MRRITVTLTESQLKNILNALYEWTDSLESFDPEPGLEQEATDLIAFNKRLINKLAKS